MIEAAARRQQPQTVVEIVFLKETEEAQRGLVARDPAAHYCEPVRQARVVDGKGKLGIALFERGNITL